MTLKVYQFDDHQRIEQNLVDFIDQVREAFPFTKLRVMKYGWSSPKGDWEGSWLSPEVLEIKNFFVSKLPAGPWELFTWFNVLEPGGTIGSHDHIQADWAAAYHISGPGDLLMDLGPRVEMLPAYPGRLAVFPGTMEHSVPQPVAWKRYSLSINAHFKGHR